MFMVSRYPLRTAMQHVAVEPTNPAFEYDESDKWFPEERGRCLQELGPSVEDEGGGGSRDV
jgi:hypothetical protein